MRTTLASDEPDPRYRFAEFEHTCGAVNFPRSSTQSAPVPSEQIISTGPVYITPGRAVTIRVAEIMAGLHRPAVRYTNPERNVA